MKSASAYDFDSIEAKWREYWHKHKTFATRDPQSGDRTFYVLDMFPYPSGYGLHVGHPVGYLASDIAARYKRMRGYLVLHPMGWDAFGLPAEQQAIKTGEHPSISVAKNVANYRKQMDLLALSYDWDREINTTDPAYYRWTQRIFVALYNAWFDPDWKKARPIEELPIPPEVTAKGPLAVQEYQARFRLVYLANSPVNWCPAIGTVLANEEVYEGRSIDGHDVIRLPMRQVIMRITAFADRLLDGLEILDWPVGIKELQRNWVGRTSGVEIRFPVVGETTVLTAFTTRPETLGGVTFLAIAPEHPLVGTLPTPECVAAVRQYQEMARNKSDLSRTKGAEKTGVATGRHVINPITRQPVPIFVADYVLAEHGTGVVMGVPAHDERDFEFARKYGVAVVPVLAPHGPDRDAVLAGRLCWLGEGEMLDLLPPAHAGAYSAGMSVAQAREAISRYLEANGLGTIAVHYKLRDWVFARQRYWGDPIPLIHWEDGMITCLTPEELPLELPYVESFQPMGDGQSGLARATDWVNVTDPATGKKGQRETSTMPQWAGSCWYPLRFMDPHNHRAIVDREKEKAWGPVDLYIGGAEHATLHLLYARFWYLAMYDLGLIVTEEPFKKLVNQGMLVSYAYENKRGVVLPVDEVVEAEEGKYVHQPTGEPVTRIVAKMSKSLRNVVNPDDVIQRFGSDTFRMHLMFMGPVEGGRVWETSQVGSMLKFLRRVWMMTTGGNEDGLRDTIAPEDEEEAVKVAVNVLIDEITKDMEELQFNTAVAELMKFTNAVEGKPMSRDTLEKFIRVLNPLAPHLAEELWERAGHHESIAYETWPAVDRAVLEKSLKGHEVVIQVQGRKRDVILVPLGVGEDDLRLAVLRHLHGLGRYEIPEDARVIVVREKQSGRPRLVNVVGVHAIS